MKTYEQKLEELKEILQGRLEVTNKLDGSKKELDLGRNYIGKKIIEEAAEVWMASLMENKDPKMDLLKLELAQLQYHILCMMAVTEITFEEIYARIW